MSASRCCSLPRTSVTQLKSVKTYWWKGRANFGDALAPLLLERFAHLKAEWTPVQRAELFTIGSVLDTPGIHGNDKIILGSGKLRESSIGPYVGKYLAVRGPLTRPGLDVPYGDPGLLAEELVTVKRRTHDLGILPHWSDDGLATDVRFTKYHPLIIDPSADPLDVVAAIGSCHKIVTSSLHGAIVADSFGIPRRIEVAPRFAEGAEGGMFKFRDYNASVGVPHRIGLTQRAEKQNVETIQHILFDLYDSLEDYL